MLQEEKCKFLEDEFRDQTNELDEETVVDKKNYNKIKQIIQRVLTDVHESLKKNDQYTDLFALITKNKE